MVDTSFKSALGTTISVEQSSLTKANQMISSITTSPPQTPSPGKTKRGRDDQVDNDRNIYTNEQQQQQQQQQQQEQQQQEEQQQEQQKQEQQQHEQQEEIKNEKKINKIDNKEKTAFKTASNHPIRVSKEVFNKSKSLIDSEFEKDIDLSKYQADIQLLEQPVDINKN